MCLVYYLLTKEDACARLLSDMSRLLNSRYSTYIAYILSHMSLYIEIYTYIHAHTSTYILHNKLLTVTIPFEYHHLIELSAMMGMFYTCNFQ